jgi:hypothetical protein
LTIAEQPSRRNAAVLTTRATQAGTRHRQPTQLHVFAGGALQEGAARSQRGRRAGAQGGATQGWPQFGALQEATPPVRSCSCSLASRTSPFPCCQADAALAKLRPTCAR